MTAGLEAFRVIYAYRSREFDAPKHLVYKAWTTPELVKRCGTRAGAK